MTIPAPPSPFVGLAAFTPRMADYFTGRERFALTLAGALFRARITVLYGQPGAGKSSLLGAALPQALRAVTGRAAREAARPAFRLLNFRRWHRGFEDRLFRAAAAKLGAPRGAALHGAVAAYTAAAKGPVILVLDQFEEFFLYCQNPQETPFCRDLAAIVADPALDAHVLLSLREDALASLDGLRAVIPGILTSPVQLRPLDRAAAERAVIEPVQLWSRARFGDAAAIVIDPALLPALLHQVRQPARAGVGAEPAFGTELMDLPLLQLSLERLWQAEVQAAGTHPPALRWETLQTLGGAAGIARAHLEGTLNALPASGRALAIRMFGHLVTPTGGKHAWRSIDLAKELDSNDMAERAAWQGTHVRRLVGKALRVLKGRHTPSLETRSTEVRDTLCRLAEGRARILRTQPDPSGPAPLFELYHDALAVPVREWVQAARIADAERRLTRQAVVAGAAILVLLGVIGGMLHLNHAAEQQRREAELQRENAQLAAARAVASVANDATGSGDAMTAMLADLAVLPKDPSHPDRPVSSAAAASLLGAWQHNREIAAFIGHTGPLTSMAISPDGHRLVTGSSDHTARVWNLDAPGAAPIVLAGHNKRINSVAFSPDGRRVVTGSDDRTARVWDLSGPTPTSIILRHTEAVVSVAFGPDGSLVGTTDSAAGGQARIWDFAAPAPTAPILSVPERLEDSVVFSPDRRHLMAGGTLWALDGPMHTASAVTDYGPSVTCASFSPDSQRVATGDWDGEVRIRNLSVLEKDPIVLSGAAGSIHFVAFSPDGRRIVSIAADGTWIWDLSGPKPIPVTLAGPAAFGATAAFSPDSFHLVTTSQDRTALVWNLAVSPPSAVILAGHTGPVHMASFTPDGKRIVTGSYDQTARLWAAAAPIRAPIVAMEDSLRTVLNNSVRPVLDAAFSPDGLRFVTASESDPFFALSTNDIVKVWNLAGGKMAAVTLDDTNFADSTLALSADGRRVAVAPIPAFGKSMSIADQSIGPMRVWDLSAAAPHAVADLNKRRAYFCDIARSCAAFSADGRRLIAVSSDNKVGVWDLSKPTAAAHFLPDQPAEIFSVALSADGQRAVTGAADSLARVWDLTAPTAKPTILKGHTQRVTSAAFSPDGRRIVTGSSDTTARVWKLADPAVAPIILAGHTGRITSVAFSPDGRRIVTGSDDQTARVWDLEGPTPAATILAGQTSFITSVAFSPDGRRVVATSYDGSAWVWPVPPLEELVPLATAALTRCLTTAQRDSLGLPPLPNPNPDRDQITRPPCH